MSFAPHRERALAIAIGSLLLAAPAAANGIWGSPLMLAHTFQLWIGNLLIGVAEGLVIWKFFQVRPLRAVLTMIAANYFSTWTVALLFLVLQLGLRGDVMGLSPYVHPFVFASGHFVAFFLASVLLEWPFCAFALRQSPAQGRSIHASLLAQTCSYALLIPFIIGLSTLRLENISLRKDVLFAKDKKIWIYFISPQDGDLYRIRPDGSARERLVQLGELASPNIQVWVPKRDGVFSLELINGKAGRDTRIATKLAGTRFVPSDQFATSGRAYDLRTGVAKWDVAYGSGGSGLLLRPNGLYATGPGGISRRAVLEFPGSDLRVGAAAVLPSEQVVFQWGDSIMLLDLESGDMARISMGRGPCVAIE